MKVTVVVPSLNEESNIGRVLEGALPHCDEILVIDGGSTDGTQAVVQSLGIPFVRQAGKGKGAAIAQTAELVTSGVVVFIDADQSHDPRDIPRLAQPIKDDAADLVIGSRMLGGSDELFTTIPEFTRLIGGHILTLAISKRFRKPLTDSQNGFRAINATILPQLRLQQKDFTIEMEMCIEALRRGFRVREVPTHEYRRASGKSNIRPLVVGPHYVWVCARGIARRRRLSQAHPGKATPPHGAAERGEPQWGILSNCRCHDCQ